MGQLLGGFDGDCKFTDFPYFSPVCSVFKVMGRSILRFCNTQRTLVREQQRGCEGHDEEQQRYKWFGSSVFSDYPVPGEPLNVRIGYASATWPTLG